MLRYGLNFFSIVLGGLLIAACTGTAALATEPRATTPSATGTAPARLHTPTGITIVAVAKLTQLDTPTPPPTAKSALSQIVLQGRVYDAGQGVQRRIGNATLDWQFFAPDWQQHNGRMAV